MIRIGDVFEIPLSDGRKAYGQYVYKESGGPIIRIFDYFTLPNQELNLQSIDTLKLLFQPIYAGITAAIREGIWKKVGKLPSDDYVFKGFINDIPEISKDKTAPVRIKRWGFWDGKKQIFFGSTLPEQYINYETTAVYPAPMVAERIETGFDMYAFPKKNNRFLTKEEIKKKYPKVKL